ncbi:MAG: hypothetical protein DCF20_01735 [Pseudanabaena sp.]|nr:MAG: hypothetical protein DCF20_01735 [Pseudanabaena sp.]
MSVTEYEDYEDIDKNVISSGWMTVTAIGMILLGIIAIAFPFFATIASTVLFGCLFILAGISQIFYTIQSRGAGKVILKMTLGLLYLFAGVFVIVNPLQGAFAFTIVLGITIFLQGMIQVSLSLQMRWFSPNWGWMLVSGLMGIIFGIFVWSSSPLNDIWLIGTLIGINLLFDGIWMLTLHSVGFTQD